MVDGDIAAVTVDIETVKVGVFDISVDHIVATEDSPFRDGAETTDMCVSKVAHQEPIARMVDMRVSAPENHGVEEYVGGVEDVDECIVGGNDVGLWGDDDDVAKGGLWYVLEFEEKSGSGGAAVTQEGDIDENKIATAGAVKPAADKGRT